MLNHFQKHNRSCSRLASATALFVSLVSARAQESKIDAVLKQLEQLHSFEDVSISPDGRWVTWGQPGEDNPRNTQIYKLDWKNSSAKPERVSAGDGKQSYRETGLAWSPDSTQMAFFSNAGSGDQAQIYLMPSAGGGAHRITNVTGYATDIHWSPDGKRLAFLYAENGGGGGPLEAVPPLTGAIGSEIHNLRIVIVDVGGGEMRRVSPAELNVYEYDWAPDGTRFAALAAPGPGDNNWWTAKLYIVSIRKSEMDSAYTPPADRQLAIPRWSPDGKQIAFIGGLMSDQGFNGGDIFVASSQAESRAILHLAEKRRQADWFGTGATDLFSLRPSRAAAQFRL